MGSQTTSWPSIFVDSSVLLAASLSSTGSAADLITYADQGVVELHLSQDVLDEVERNLRSKAPQGMARFTAIRDRLSSVLAAPNKALIEEAARVVVAKDAPIVAAAITAQADYIVSYDRRHLVNSSAQIEGAFGIPVLTPVDLLLTIGLPLIEREPKPND